MRMCQCARRAPKANNLTIASATMAMIMSERVKDVAFSAYREFEKPNAAPMTANTQKTEPAMVDPAKKLGSGQ